MYILHTKIFKKTLLFFGNLWYYNYTSSTTPSIAKKGKDMKKIDLNYYPGWTRKAISFTIDDGWLDMDTKFISIVKPCGIKGTFNISSHNVIKYEDNDLIRATYRGFEISNHVKRHPRAFDDSVKVTLSDEFFNASEADKKLCYREKGCPDGVYLKYSEKYDRWDRVCTAEGYITLTELCKTELEEIFGEGSVRGFVWPFCRQNNSETIEYLKKNYYGLRDAGKEEPMKDKTFSLPLDRSNWQYNARHSNLLVRAAEYESLEDDGALKWFCFGVHSVDFERAENAGKWEDLEEFAAKYGNRPENYWYATNAEVFDYEDAVKAVIIGDDHIKNPTEITLHITVDGKRITLAPKSEVKI